MSGHYNSLMIGLGVASCLLCSWLSLRIGALDQEGFPTHLLAKLPSYIIWLLGETLLSNISTAKIILRGSPDPEVFKVPAHQITAAGLSTYANSITLTPGTVTVDIEETQIGGSRFIVHALHPQFGDDVRSGDMDRRNCALEGGYVNTSVSSPTAKLVVEKADEKRPSSKKRNRKSRGSALK